MNYYKIITEDCEKYFAATQDGVTKIKLEYDAARNIKGADYNPNVASIPNDVDESTFDEFTTARNAGENFNGEVAFVGHEPIHAG